MPSTHPRVQATVDPELAAAMAAVDPDPQADRAASATSPSAAPKRNWTPREHQRDAIDYLLKIARRDTDYDFDRVREIDAQREAGRE